MWRCVLLTCVVVCVAGTPATDAAQPDPHECATEVDRLLASDAASRTSAPAPEVDDETFLRRAFLDLVGEPPTADDVLAFVFQGDDKRSQLVKQLLADDGFGRNWARYWRDVILYRRSEERALAVAESLTSYLREQFDANTPWSTIARELITASGDVRENGKTGLIMAQAGMPEDVTAEVSRIFLGIQIQCAQCHDHPTDRWKREQFHQLTAFFPRIAVRPDRGGDVPTFLVTVNDRPFAPPRQNNNNRFAGTPEHYMPNLDDPTDRGARMQPIFFLSGQKLAFGTPDADRRGAAAEWITAKSNPWFAKAFVNRIWAELVGEGFYEPIDDLGPDRQCSAPRTLDYLAEQFAASDYDVKWLFETVMATQAYQRESRARRNYEALPFQANCAQRLRGDQLFDSLLSALDIPERAPQRPGGPGGGGPYQPRNNPRVTFNLAFGFDLSDPREEVGGSIQQALVVMNSPFVNQAISARRRDGLGQLLRNHTDNKEALVELYLKTLSRAPSDDEVATCLGYVRQVGDRNEAFEDVLWALINSTEFLHRK